MMLWGGSMKYDINKMYTIDGYSKLKVSISQTGSKAMIREKGEDEATLRQGYRIVIEGETIGYGNHNQSEHDLLVETLKQERYSHLAYKEAYNDLLRKLASIGLVQVSESELDDRF